MASCPTVGIWSLLAGRLLAASSQTWDSLSLSPRSGHRAALCEGHGSSTSACPGPAPRALVVATVANSALCLPRLVGRGFWGGFEKAVDSLPRPPPNLPVLTAPGRTPRGLQGEENQPGKQQAPGTALQVPGCWVTLSPACSCGWVLGSLVPILTLLPETPARHPEVALGPGTWSCRGCRCTPLARALPLPAPLSQHLSHLPRGLGSFTSWSLWASPMSRTLPAQSHPQASDWTLSGHPAASAPKAPMWPFLTALPEALAAPSPALGGRQGLPSHHPQASGPAPFPEPTASPPFPAGRRYPEGERTRMLVPERPVPSRGLRQAMQHVVPQFPSL